VPTTGPPSLVVAQGTHIHADTQTYTERDIHRKRQTQTQRNRKRQRQREIPTGAHTHHHNHRCIGGRQTGDRNKGASVAAVQHRNRTNSHAQPLITGSSPSAWCQPRPQRYTERRTHTERLKHRDTQRDRQKHTLSLTQTHPLSDTFSLTHTHTPHPREREREKEREREIDR